MTQELENLHPPAVGVVELAERHLELALAALSDAVLRKTGELTSQNVEVEGAALEVVAALRMLFVLRARIEDDERRDEASAGVTTQIDLEDARSKIGCLLDRLRDEDSTDEVSE